ncbi:MAG: hypothetical protein Q9219_000364 [cf. Caloplaca sp. 3 TL-2023]
MDWFMKQVHSHVLLVDQDARVRELVNVSADFNRIPPGIIPQIRGKDGFIYYQIDHTIEITYYSGYTTYELIYKDKNYGPVTAEYV